MKNRLFTEQAASFLLCDVKDLLRAIDKVPLADFMKQPRFMKKLPRLWLESDDHDLPVLLVHTVDDRHQASFGR